MRRWKTQFVKKDKNMFESHLLEEVEHWVVDLGYFRTRETNYFRIEKVYWMVKAMIAQAMEKKKEQ